MYLIISSNALKLFNIIFRNAVSSVEYIAKAHLFYGKYTVNVRTFSHSSDLWKSMAKSLWIR